jgi:hypothetical protein
VKRPILGLLAAAMLSLGLLGSSPVQAATTPSPATATPAHHDDDNDGHKYSARHPQGGTRHHGHDDDDRGHRRRGPCSGLIVLFCRA